MKKIPYGCVMLARKIQESEIWIKKPSWWYKTWTHILMKVNHRNNPQFKRGTNFFNMKKIYGDCFLYNEGIKEEAVKNFIRFLKKRSMITTQKTTRGFVLTVCNYELYQNLDNYKNPTENSIKTPSKPHRNSTINNNDNNVKNGKNDIKRSFVESSAINQIIVLPKPPKKIKLFSEDSMEFRLAKLLFNQIKKRKPDFKEPNFQVWSKKIDKMIKIDNRKPEKIKEIIKWCQKDDFWQNNILSTKKLRKQFDQLELRMKGTKEFSAEDL